MENIIEKWAGIISGTNRGSVILELQYLEGNRVTGSLKIYDPYEANLSCELEGTSTGKSVSGKIYNFQPQGEGVPTSGSVNLILDEGGKEMKGNWETNINTNGECMLYKFASLKKEVQTPEPKLSLETKDISISFSTFDQKNVVDIFSIMTSITHSIREGKGQDILPPIYSITYDKEERIRTFDFEYFLSKFRQAEKIYYLGFEFKNNKDLTNVYINISRQESLALNLKSNALVESTNKETITLIPEMIRGLVSKTRNKHSFWHKWFFGAAIQLLGVFAMLAFSFLISRQFIQWSSMENIGAYSFVTVLIILSNVWTYLGNSILNIFYRFFPVVEIINKPKNKIWPTIVISITGSIFAYAIIYLMSLLLKILLPTQTP